MNINNNNTNSNTGSTPTPSQPTTPFIINDEATRMAPEEREDTFDESYFDKMEDDENSNNDTMMGQFSPLNHPPSSAASINNITGHNSNSNLSVGEEEDGDDSGEDDDENNEVRYIYIQCIHYRYK